MSAHSIPVTSDASWYDLSVTLEGRRYNLELRWNERSEAWFLTIADADGKVLAAGRRVMLGANLLGRSRNAALPPGVLLAFDTAASGADAGRADLGGRVKLIYVESGG